MACRSSVLATAMPVSLGFNGSPDAYSRSARPWIMLCRVDLVPRLSSSIFIISLLWVYRAGGWVCFPSISLSTTRTMSPSPS